MGVVTTFMLRLFVPHEFDMFIGKRIKSVSAFENIKSIGLKRSSLIGVSRRVRQT